MLILYLKTLSKQLKRSWDSKYTDEDIENAYQSGYNCAIVEMEYKEKQEAKQFIQNAETVLDNINVRLKHTLELINSTHDSAGHC